MAMNNEQKRSLSYARAVMDYESDKQINASALKWQAIALKYNKGFTAKKTFLISMDDDIVFSPLLGIMHCADFCTIILFSQDQDSEVAKT